ncbi:MAG: sodium:solute symporter family protein [Phycisphaerales bacterium]|nr:MAG: sodium:solute symporter family protein [Phycisphaerales bacterium]
MGFLGLDLAIWVVLALYFAGMLLMGFLSKRTIHNQEGYLLGNRRFGVTMMIMHAFGAGTHPGAPAGVISKTVSSGASGVWVSWMWMFGTPFYWIIAPIIRRMRYLTMADFFQKRFSRAAGVLYVVVATVGMIVFLASVLLATTRTVQGMMGKATPGTVQVHSNPSDSDQSVTDYVGEPESEMWFFAILFTITAVFLIYSYWGGIVAAIRTDTIQGLMIIALSFIAIPAALGLEDVGGLAGMRATLESQKTQAVDYLSLFDPGEFNLVTVLLLCVNAPLSMLAIPHLMSVCGAGRTEWEGRVGFTYGNILKRVCTIGWCLLGLCWLAYLINTGSAIHPDAAFGDSIRALLSPVLQGVMLACVMAAAMSSGDAVQVTVAGLFSQNVYRVYLNPGADERQLVRVTRVTGLAVALMSLLAAILMRSSIVKTILDYFNILSLVGISVAMGILWRRMNTAGVFCSTISAVSTFIMTRYVLGCPRDITIGAPILIGILAGVIGSLLTKPPSAETIEEFFKRIYVPIGEEKKLDLPIDEAVPRSKRWLTAGGLFIVKPSRQSWVGFIVTLAMCIVCVAVMLAILNL